MTPSARMRVVQGVLSGHVGDILETQEDLPAQLGWDLVRPGDLERQGASGTLGCRMAGTRIPRDLGMRASTSSGHLEFGTAALPPPGIGGHPGIRNGSASGYLRTHRSIFWANFPPFHTGPERQEKSPGQVPGRRRLTRGAGPVTQQRSSHPPGPAGSDGWSG